MIVSGIGNFINNINISTKSINFKQHFNPSFCAVKPLEEDTLELSNKRNVKIKDREGNDIDAVITEKKSKLGDGNEKKFILKTNNKQLGYAIVSDDDCCQDRLYLAHLYTQEHNHRQYKGAGTELLKSAVYESIKRGYGGKMRVYASHGYASPLAFYYKNNFIISQPHNTELYGYPHNKNAAIQYAIENDIPVDNMLFEHHRHSNMLLDENGAKAFLMGIRLYKDRIIEKLAQKNIDGVNCSVNLIQSPYKDENILFVIAEDKEKLKTQFLANLIVKENGNGKKHFIIRDLDEYAGYDEHRNFAFETLEKAAKEKGFDKTTISDDLRSEAKRYYKNSPIKFDVEKVVDLEKCS